MMRWLSMSSRTLAYDWPRRLAQSSTPSTATLPISGSGSALISRISVHRDTIAPSARASRDPARPASASVTRASRLRSPIVRRWCLAVSPPRLLGERRHNAGRVVADEPADLEYDLDRTAATGQVLKTTPATVVDPCGRLAALRAGHRRRARARYEPDQIAKVLHLVQLQAAQVGEQRVSQAGFLSGQLMPHNRPPRPLR